MSKGAVTDVITGPGEYVTADGRKAVVEYVNDVWAFGHISNAGVKTHIGFWLKADGLVQHYDGERLSIKGPYVPARKRVEGWVNILVKQEYSYSHLYSNREEADQWRLRRTDCVFVREIDPAAEKEAREILEEEISIFDGSPLGTKLRRALSLLLRDEAPDA